MRGRKPIPTSIKRARGNPGKHRLNNDEPQPAKKVPRCPPFLDAEAKRAWRQFSKLLLANGVMTEMDGPALATLCQVWSRWKYAEEQVQKYGPVMLSPEKRFPIYSPYLAVANRAMDQLSKALTEFGMTPSSRCRVGIEINNGLDEDSLAVFIAKGQLLKEQVQRDCELRAQGLPPLIDSKPEPRPRPFGKHDTEPDQSETA
jgi:P27 family predicted phage terminase small subunit